MELWKELLVFGLESGDNEFVDNETIKELVNTTSYKALLSIKEVLDDLKLSDEECFFKIEKIILALEEKGIFTERHDFV